MTTLQITRPREWQNKLRKYQLYVDGEKIGEIANGETRDFILPDGPHTVMAKIDWCSSPEITFNTQGEGVYYLKVASSKVVQWVTLTALVLLLVNFVMRLQFHRDFLLFIAAPVILVMLYIFTIGRKKYLTLQPF